MPSAVKTYLFLTTGFFIFTLTFSLGASQECSQRYFGYDSFVCVCNDTYCDFIGNVPIPASGYYTVITSSRDEFRFKTETFAFQSLQNQTGSLKVSLNQSDTYQAMFGFGAAFTDATGINLAKLHPPLQDLVMRSYFSSEGIEYSYARIPIAGCDFSVRPYSYDDVPDDVDLEFFSLQQEDYLYKIPYIKQAMNMTRRPLLFFGSPWSPPSWMKENGMFNGTGGLLDQYWQPYSNYFVKFVEAYEGEGVPIWGLTVQNEPIAGYLNWEWNACGFTSEEMRDFVKFNLGPTLSAAGMRRIKLMILDDQRAEMPWYPAKILNDTEAAQYVDGIAVHWYWDKETPPSLLTNTHDLFPDSFIFYTEACEGYLGPLSERVQLGNWRRAENYAESMIENVNHWSTAWTDWNMVLDMQGGPNWASNYVDAPVIADPDAAEVYKEPLFYAMGHLSKFITVGAVRIGVIEEFQKDDETKNLSFKTAAFLTPEGNLVTIILNKRNNTEFLLIDDIIGGQQILLEVPAHSIQTIVYTTV